MELCEAGVNRLRFEITKQAVNDYYHAKRYMDITSYDKYARAQEYVERHEHRDPTKRLAEAKSLVNSYEKKENVCKECRRFFRSQWFEELCGIDGEQLITDLNRKARNDEGLDASFTREWEEDECE